jgi:hypothetical protein
MSDATFVQGNTDPDMTAKLTNADGTVKDLTSVSSVMFQMRKPDDRRFTVNALAAVDGDPTLGNVRYQWAPNDLAVPGDYNCQWLLQYTDGREQTTTPPNTITVQRA